MTKTVVITGASSGFGALSARALADAGHVVYAGMRDIDAHNATQAAEAKQYAAGHDVDLRPVELDVSSQRSVEEAVGTVISEQGNIDVLLHNAVHMVTGSTEGLQDLLRPHATHAPEVSVDDRAYPGSGHRAP
jgi:NAD(P)-dependent dehydrogenase (short-subunit alcohol dehydrogenase family)